MDDGALGVAFEGSRKRVLLRRAMVTDDLGQVESTGPDADPLKSEVLTLA